MSSLDWKSQRIQLSLPHSKTPLRPVCLCQRPTLFLYPCRSVDPAQSLRKGTCVVGLLSGDIIAHALTLGFSYSHLYRLSRLLVAQELWVGLILSQISRQKAEAQIILLLDFLEIS